MQLRNRTNRTLGFAKESFGGNAPSMIRFNVFRLDREYERESRSIALRGL